MTYSQRKIGFFLSCFTVFSTASVLVEATETAQMSSYTVAYRITDVENYERYRRRDSDTQLNLSGTGALNTFDQRAIDLREAQRLQQQQEIERRNFDNNRVIAPRATTPPRDIIDNARNRGLTRRTGSVIDDPRLHLQELRETTEMNRIENLKSDEASGPCAGLSRARLVQCLYKLQTEKN